MNPIQEYLVLRSVDYFTMALPAAVVYDQVFNFGRKVSRLSLFTKDSLRQSATEVDLIWVCARIFIPVKLGLKKDTVGSMLWIGNCSVSARLEKNSPSVLWHLFATITLALEDVAAAIIVNWSTNIFIIAMQAILLMRVSALWNRSKMVPGFLLVCYGGQVIAVVAMTGMEFNLLAMRKLVLFVGPSIGNVAQMMDLDEAAFVPPLMIGRLTQLMFDAPAVDLD
ncbi:hypothetical protein BV22DRAFT_1052354, partial [Leucogyrophana mollusca]